MEKDWLMTILDKFFFCCASLMIKAIENFNLNIESVAKKKSEEKRMHPPSLEFTMRRLTASTEKVKKRTQ